MIHYQLENDDYQLIKTLLKNNELESVNFF